MDLSERVVYLMIRNNFITPLEQAAYLVI